MLWHLFNFLRNLQEKLENYIPFMSPTNSPKSIKSLGRKTQSLSPFSPALDVQAAWGKYQSSKYLLSNEFLEFHINIQVAHQTRKKSYLHLFHTYAMNKKMSHIFFFLNIQVAHQTRKKSYLHFFHTYAMNKKMSHVFTFFT